MKVKKNKPRNRNAVTKTGKAAKKKFQVYPFKFRLKVRVQYLKAPPSPFNIPFSSWFSIFY